MRKITTIVTHHSVSPQTWDNAKTLAVIDKEHIKLHPEKNSFGLHVSYHYLLFPDGLFRNTRAVDEVGYHAGNYPVNLVSIGICLIGNFEVDYPTVRQALALKRLLKSLLIRHQLKNSDIKLHKEVRIAPTACPGKNITHEFIHSLIS